MRPDKARQRATQAAMRTYNCAMVSLHKQRLLHAWIACLAILFGALAPAVSHALAYAHADIRINIGKAEICSVDGARSVSAGAASSAAMPDGPAGSLLHHLQQCPYCMPHASPAALLPPALFHLAVLDGHDVFPSLFYDAPAPLFAWRAAYPRAPPFID